MAALLPRPGILEIDPYVPGKSWLAGGGRIIRLASNESALGPSPRAVAAFEQAAAELGRYPDGASTELRQAIGARFGLDPARIVCGSGSDELMGLLGRAFVGPGDEVLYSQYGFLMYPIVARSLGARSVTAPETELRADVDAMLGKVTAKTRLVFLANPNNPTGSYVPRDEVRRLRVGLPGDVLLVLDAAYAEYVTAEDYSPGVELVDAGDNVVMTRTFSKLFGLASLRIGWAYCPPGVADVLNRLRNPFNVTGPAQAAGAAAVEDVEFADKARAHNTLWLPWLADRLSALGLRVYPSIANFVLVRFPAGPGRDAGAANGFLNDKGIIVREVAGYGLPDCLRITVGLEEEMRAVVDALAEFVD